jgi:hypothetical protein
MDLQEMRNRATVLSPTPWPSGSVDWIGFDDSIMELKEIQEANWKYQYGKILQSGAPTNADGIFYWDTREPFISVDVAAVTLATTNKALYPAGAFPVLGGQYWARPGKKIRIRMFGRITTAATPGNLQFNTYYGSGADATGTIIMSSATLALTASQTNLSWESEQYVHCRTTGGGTLGSLFGTGKALFNNAVVASTLQPIMIPASVPAVVGSLDLTSANIISCQFLRSGSTAETIQVHDLEVTALN